MNNINNNIIISQRKHLKAQPATKSHIHKALKSTRLYCQNKQQAVGQNNSKTQQKPHNR
jgi:hypothetical protein